MKLIRSSFWSYGFFCLSTPPILLEYFILWFDVLGFPSFFFLAASPPSFQLLRLQLRFVVLGVKH